MFFYPLLGYYFEEKINVFELNNKKMLQLGAIVFFGILLSCLCTLWEGKNIGIYTKN